MRTNFMNKAYDSVFGGTDFIGSLMTVLRKRGREAVEEVKYNFENALNGVEMLTGMAESMGLQDKNAAEKAAMAGDAVVSALKQNRHCIIKTNCTQEARQEVNTLCQIHSLSRHELGNKISTFMGRLTVSIVNSYLPIGGLFLSGGDIATAVATAFNADCTPKSKAKSEAACPGASFPVVQLTIYPL